MPNAEKRARQLSWLYYNQGLERARVRDLSGAETKLRESLQLHKRNIAARNLLGLVYFETGEVVAALQEWLISQSFQSKDNPASDYIASVQADQNRFRTMQESIETYNKALQNCRDGNDDIAAIQLRRILSKNPKQIRAAQLLALIQLKEGRWNQAKKVLRRAEQVDKTNPLTLRYLQEAETALRTASQGRGKSEVEETEEVLADTGTAQQTRFRDRPVFSTVLNLLIGLALGILSLAFLIVPAVRRNVSQETNTRIIDYTTTIAEQKDRITNLETQIDESNAVVAQAREQVESSQKESDSYDSLLKAYNYLQSSEYMRACDEIEKVDASKLSNSAVEIYNAISGTIEANAYDEYEYAGDVAYYQENWIEAINYFEKAIAIKIDGSDVLNLLANACVEAGQNEKAIHYFQMILDQFPDTRRAENAEYMITILGGTPDYSGGSAQSSTEESDADQGEVAEEEDSEETTYEEATYDDEDWEASEEGNEGGEEDEGA